MRGSISLNILLCNDLSEANDRVAKSNGGDVGKPPCYVMIYQRPMMELLSPMVVMLEGLGFNLCVATFLNICAPNLLQGVGSGEC